MSHPAILYRQARAAERRAAAGGAPDTARVLGAVARMIALEAGLDPEAEAEAPLGEAA